MRTLTTHWQCDPNTNELCVVTNTQGELCNIRVGIKDITLDIQRVQSYIDELSTVEAIDVEPTDQPSSIRIVS